MLLYSPFDYIRGYFKHKRSKNLKDDYKQSYNKFFICIWKDIWVNGDVDMTNYIKPSRKVTPRLSREMRAKLIDNVNKQMETGRGKEDEQL